MDFDPQFKLHSARASVYVLLTFKVHFRALRSDLRSCNGLARNLLLRTPHFLGTTLHCNCFLDNFLKLNLLVLLYVGNQFVRWMLFPFSVPLIKKDFDVTYNKKLCREMKELFENFEDVYEKEDEGQ